eukprot:gnl/MRDRNA2_/MRDRNA2_185005_c0_seq1.p1 gnl/MRDRNA2_/MRDRNA2_185005_c0~~gnl/MRDRNA2_/MRDRNA2_185005_c0_seq1.p1  ORF type:complete len:139 (-),score=22.46 gnl/MRDRNA2_/MRDRNA2_185005_c0_seq1:62-478(-)
MVPAPYQFWGGMGGICLFPPIAVGTAVGIRKGGSVGTSTGIGILACLGALPFTFANALQMPSEQVEGVLKKWKRKPQKAALFFTMAVMSICTATGIGTVMSAKTGNDNGKVIGATTGSLTFLWGGFVWWQFTIFVDDD